MLRMKEGEDVEKEGSGGRGRRGGRGRC